MRINITDSIKPDLDQLLTWIQDKNNEEVQQRQEEIITTLGLVINPRFQKIIKLHRIKFKVPTKWHTPKHSDDLYDEYLDYHDKIKTAPTNVYDPAITHICDSFGLDRKKYREFILDYMYYGNVWVYAPPHYKWFEHFYMKDEYRHRARFEIDYGEGKEEKLTDQPQKASIRIYQDTSKTGLIEFIENNWLEISKIQKELPEYPHSKRYGRFKRDIQIYILHLLGKNTNEIAKILDENIPEDIANKAYYVDGSAIRQTAVDIEKRIADLFPKV